MERIALLLILLLLFPIAYSQPTIKEFRSNLDLSEYNFGFLTLQLSLSSLPDKLEIIYPNKFLYYNLESNVKANLESIEEGNSTKFTIFFEEKDKEALLNMALVLKNVIKKENETFYSLYLTLIPHINLPIQKAQISVGLPNGLTPTKEIKGLSLIGNRLEGNFTNVTDVRRENILLRSTTKIYNVSFPYAERLIDITPLGDIKVRDIITLVNEGEEKIGELKLEPLIKGVFSAKVGLLYDLRLQAQKDIPFFTGNLPISKEYFLKDGLDKGERLSFEIIYDFPKEKISKDTLDFYLKLDTSPPVFALIEDYKIRISLPQGFSLKSKDSYLIEKANPLNLKELEFKYSLTPFWSLQNSFPLSSLIFLLSFLLLIGLKREKKDTYLKRFTDILNIVFSLKRIEREEIQSLAQQIQSIKNLYSSKDLKEKLKGEAFTEVLNLERSFDKIVAEILNLYYRVVEKKLDLKVMERVLKEQRLKLEEIVEKLKLLI